MSITRRSFFLGIGSVSVGLLFRRRLDAVLEDLSRELADEPQAPDQPPSAAEIVVLPQMSFRPDRLLVASAIAPLFEIEDVHIGNVSQVASCNGSCGLPADVFSTASCADAPISFSTVSPGTEIRLRVRYVGMDPAGARFLAAMIGNDSSSPERVRRLVLPIDSGVAIVA
jgi:hypothetical protein